MYGYFIASVTTVGKSPKEIEEETLRLMNTNGGLGRKFLKWENEPDCRKLYFKVTN